jgi:AraC-like DNA-binding protein
MHTHLLAVVDTVSGGIIGMQDDVGWTAEEAQRRIELAALCKLSVRQLTRGFRASRDCSIGDYVANSRIERAKRLLTSDQSIKTIAYSLGFNSSSGFCFAFRRATGMTPGEFRASGAALCLTSESVLRWS